MPSELTRTQRYLTTDFIKKHRLAVPVLWFKPESATPDSEDLTKPREGLDCNLDEWLDTDRNVGIRLCDGFIELKLKTPDDIWAAGLFKAFRFLSVDARAAFGTTTISSILLKVDGAIDKWANHWPKGHKDKNGAWVATQFVTSQLPTTKNGKPVWHHSAPLPGSRFGDRLVVWRPMGKPAAADPELGLDDLEARPIAATNMESICRSIAFATLAYWIEAFRDNGPWDASLLHVIGGWTARAILEGQAINAPGKSLEGVCWAPVDSPETARALVAFLGGGRDLLVAFERAEAALERNPDAPAPSWGSIETLFGAQAKIGIRRAFKAGLDINLIEQMAERYVYDTAEHIYVDRDALLQGAPYLHKPDDMAHVWKPKSVFNGKKFINPFDIYSGSSLRVDVLRRDFFPGRDSGTIVRYSRSHGILNGEERQPDDYLILNTFPGFAIKPIGVIDQAIWKHMVSMLDEMLGLLTKDNDAQMLWLKKFIAFIVQHPEVKQQVCPIIVGGQGIGKSIYGDNLMRALFGEMAGTADAASLSDNKFLIAPFLGKLITFIDEVKLESIAAINIIKKLVRSDVVSGQNKFKDQKDHYVPSRLMIASNSPDIGLTPTDAADRAFFFIMSWTAENKHMTDREFSDWAIGLKPFYSELIACLESVVFRQHLMRYFIDLPVERAELENLEHSSRNDENVIRSTMSKAREVARAIVADARVLSALDITAWFTTLQLRDAIKRWDDARTKVEASQVMLEFERAGVIETMRGDLRRFKWGYGKLLQKLGEAHGLPITQHWDYKPGDFDDNDVKSQENPPPWRGNRQQGQQQQTHRRNDDIDHMEPF